MICHWHQAHNAPHFHFHSADYTVYSFHIHLTKKPFKISSEGLWLISILFCLVFSALRIRSHHHTHAHHSHNVFCAGDI